MECFWMLFAALCCWRLADLFMPTEWDDDVPLIADLFVYSSMLLFFLALYWLSAHYLGIH